MTRWWKLPVLPAVVFGLGLPSAASASTHCTVSIIMTTLGTDGTSVSQSVVAPPNSNAQNSATGGKVADPSAASTGSPASGNKGSGGGSGGGGGGSGGGGNSPNSLQKNTPTAATPNTTDTAIPFDPNDSGSIPVPSNGSTDEPLPPAPPILTPDVPNTNPDVVIPDVVDGPIVDDTPLPPTNEPTGGVAEAPEPGTLTLLGLAAAGGFGYSRRKRKSA